MGDSTADAAATVDAVTHACEEADLVYVADYGAPGIGQEFVCKVCDKAWSLVRGNYYEAELGVQVGTLEDFV